MMEKQDKRNIWEKEISSSTICAQVIIIGIILKNK